MSEPKRYNFYATIVHHVGGEKTAALNYQTEPDGLFVLHEDYARLKAEVERLRKGDECDMTAAYFYAAEQSKDQIKRLKAEVERLTADLNKMTKTPDGVDYVEVDVSFWTKSGSRLPSSYSTFWSNDKGVQS